MGLRPDLDAIFQAHGDGVATFTPPAGDPVTGCDVIVDTRGVEVPLTGGLTVNELRTTIIYRRAQVGDAPRGTTVAVNGTTYQIDGPASDQPQDDELARVAAHEVAA